MKTFARVLFPLAGLACLWPQVSSAMALILGAVLAISFGNPYLEETKKWTSRFLSLAVIGLGFGMNLQVVARVGYQGLGYTFVSIALTCIVGTMIGRMLNVNRDVSLLITVGTAICGGSAIAAVASVIRAKSHDITVALGTVFLLNALALLIFPSLGHHFALNQSQFGLWAALAIHDTSSVVGATVQYGLHSAEVGTTVKLARALWIVPLALMVGFANTRGASGESATFKKPWFILGFLLAAALVTWWPALKPYALYLELGAKRLLILTLFLIGAGLTRSTLKAVGPRPFVQGVILWILVSTITLVAIAQNWIG